MRRLLSLVFPSLFVVALLAAASFITTSPASAGSFGSTVTCNNALGNGGGEGLVCEVTVVNTITPSGGSAVVTVRECQGSAGVPDTTCTNTTAPVSEPVTAVTQCDGSALGGGAVLLCSVDVTNNFIGITPTPTLTAATVNQCVGSGTTGTVLVCDPIPAATTGATITQCNGSANGGGTSLTCTATGTQSSGLAVLINQCNGSSNDGGSVTVCSTNITNNVTGAVTPAPSATGIPNTSLRDQVSADGRGTGPLVLLGLVFLAMLSAVATLRREPRSR
jgi:hypothetical protein